MTYTPDQYRLIADHLQAISSRIAAAARTCGRDPKTVRLIAVSKTKPAALVEAAFAAGQHAFGENYVQEAIDKMQVLAHLPLEWHFIGAIQGNKTRLIAEHFAWVHGLASLQHAERLSAQRPAHLPALNLCIQVNISGEASKNGIAPADLPTLAQAVQQLPHLRLRGLMALPAPDQNLATQEASFARMQALLADLQGSLPELDSLSMGMTEDFETAIRYGATLVRIGSAIFGTRGC